MNYQNRIYLLIGLTVILFLSFQPKAKATHLLGGSITWECTPTGQYVFTLTLYRDCTGIPLSANAQTLNTNAGGTITCTKVATNYLNKECNAISCQGVSGIYVGAVEEHIYKSGPVTLPGMPPPTGWYFSWVSCCRSTSMSNLINAGSTGFSLTAQMFSSGNGTCNNNAPQFLESPNPVICTNMPQRIVNTAFDVDGDSLHYSFSGPFDDGIGFPYNPVLFAAGYSIQSPFPQSANAQLDPNTGIVSLNNSISGGFANGIKVEEWRNGQLISITYRDLPVFSKPCSPPPGICGGISNTKPSISFQWAAGYDTLSPVLDSNGLISYYELIVQKGTAIKFGISGSDTQLNPNCTPQVVNFYGSSPFLAPGPTYSGNTTCAAGVNCATVTSNNAGGSFSVTGTNSVEFNWTPTCMNTSALAPPNKNFDFYLEFSDDACPYSLYNQVLVRIRVVDTTSYNINASTSVICTGDTATLTAPSGFLSYLWNTGDTTQVIKVVTGGNYQVFFTDNSGCTSNAKIDVKAIVPYTQNPEICLVTFDEVAEHNKVIWEKPAKTGTKAYVIYRYYQSPPLQVLDTLHVNAFSEYIDSSVSANMQAYSYFITLIDSCNNEYGSSFTSHTTMHLSGSQPNPNSVLLNWTPYMGANPNRYVIYRKDNPVATYYKLDSVSSNTTSYLDSNLPGGNGFSYKIGAVMDSSCVGSFKSNVEASSNPLIYATIDVEELIALEKISIYPNPSNGIYILNAPTNLLYTVYDYTARKVLVGNTKNNLIDLSKEPDGLYVVTIKRGDDTPVLFKIIKTTP
jgi:hypothetical protein